MYDKKVRLIVAAMLVLLAVLVALNTTSILNLRNAQNMAQQSVQEKLDMKISSPDSLRRGDILYYDGTDWTTFEIGSSGQILMAMDGRSMIWQNSPPRIATRVVAASNSLPDSRVQADYVCDGMDAQVEIQAAIDSMIHSVTAKSFTVVFDTWIDLAHRPILPLSEEVTSDGRRHYGLSWGGGNNDYELDYSGGRIKPLSIGSMVEGSTARIDYKYGGGKLVLLEGVYNIAASVNITSSGISIEGQNAKATVLRATTPITVLNVDGDERYINSLQISNISLDGNDKTATTAIYLNRALEFSLRDFYIIDFRDYGIYIDESVQNGVYEHGSIYRVGRGIHIDQARNQYSTFRDIWISRTIDYGVYLGGRGLTHIILENLAFTRANPTAIYIDHARLVEVSHCHFEAISGHAISAHTVGGLDIRDSRFKDSGYSHIYLNYAHAVTIMGNFMHKTGAGYHSIRLDENVRGSFITSNTIMNSGNDVSIDISSSSSEHNVIIPPVTDDTTPVSDSGTGTIILHSDYLVP